MLGACALMRWYLDEAVRFASTSDAVPELADAQLLEEWLVARVRHLPKSHGEILIAANEALKKGPHRRSPRSRRGLTNRSQRASSTRATFRSS